MAVPYFPELDHALNDLTTAEANYNDMNPGGGSGYGNEGAAMDAINDEYQSKLEQIRDRAEQMLGGMRGGRRRRGRKTRKGKGRKSRKAGRKARKTRRR